jgi:hypothetical protein
MNYAELWIDGITRLGRAEYHIKALIESLEKADLDTNWDRMNSEIAIEHAKRFLDEIRTEDVARTADAIEELLITEEIV